MKAKLRWRRTPGCSYRDRERETDDKIEGNGGRMTEGAVERFKWGMCKISMSHARDAKFWHETCLTIAATNGVRILVLIGSVRYLACIFYVREDERSSLGLSLDTYYGHPPTGQLLGMACQH